MEDRIAVLTAEIDKLKEQLHAEKRLNEMYMNGKQAGGEIAAFIQGLKDSGLEEWYIKEAMKSAFKQSFNQGGLLL